IKNKDQLPKNSVAFKGVPVEGCTLANQDGTNRALPMTQRYLAWPNMATRREATIPKLAPAPTTFPAHFHPMLWKAFENDAFNSIYTLVYKSSYFIYRNLCTL
ncbi:hypothetical protein TorRG33x02_064400, partial [Trema orientale]